MAAPVPRVLVTPVAVAEPPMAVVAPPLVMETGAVAALLIVIDIWPPIEALLSVTFGATDVYAAAAAAAGLPR